LAHPSSAEKRHRQSLRRRARNRAVRSAAHTHVSKATGLIEAGPLPEAEAALREAVSVLDRAQKKGVIHANNAAPRKSRLMAHYNAAVSAAAVAQREAPPPEEPVETGRRRRPARKTAEKPPAASTKAPAAAKGRARAAKPRAKKEDKPKKS